VVSNRDLPGFENLEGLNVLIVGCGSIGKRHARVLHELGVRDLRACDPIAEQRESLRAQAPAVKLYDSLEAGLHDKPNCVFICTPPWMHVPQAIESIRAGAHVFSEKPLSDSLDGVDELEQLAARENKKVMVGLCFRYHAGLVKAKELVDQGRIGRVVSIRALMGEHLPDVRPDYRNLFSAQKKSAFDLMHDIDLAIWFANQPVRRVQSTFGTFSDIGIAAPDTVELLIDFADRCIATVHLDFFQRPRRRQIEIIGTQGVVIVEFASWDRCTVSIFESGSWKHEEIATDRDDMFRAEDREFLEAVVQDQPILCTIGEARKSLEVVLAAQTLDISGELFYIV